MIIADGSSENGKYWHDQDGTVSLLILVKGAIGIIGHPFQSRLCLQDRVEMTYVNMILIFDCSTYVGNREEGSATSDAFSMTICDEYA